MSEDSDTLKAEIAALEAETERLLAVYLDAVGWHKLFRKLARLAEQRYDGRVAGIMEAAAEFLAKKG